MSEISKLIAEIKSKGILRAGNKMEQLYILAEQMETDYAALQQKLNSLAAENASLKQLAMDYANLADSRLSEMTANCESDCRRECYEFTNKLPVTDAYLNTVRAGGVEILTSRLQTLIDEGVFDAKEIGVAAGAVYEGAQIAANLRSGTHDTADKAG